MNIRNSMHFSSQPMKNLIENKQNTVPKKNLTPVQLAREEEDQICSSYYNESDNSQTSNSTLIPNLPPTTIYHHSRPSYFNSAIETAIEQRLDDEPIPFIDENPSATHSRKSSACWSDKTSLSSRFSLAWKLNVMRSSAQNRSAKDKQRHHHPRTIRYTIPPIQPNDEL